MESREFLTSVAFPEKAAPLVSAVCPQTADGLEALLTELRGWNAEALARRLERFTVQCGKEPMAVLDTLRARLIEALDALETADPPIGAAPEASPEAQRYALCLNLLHAVNWARDQRLLASALREQNPPALAPIPEKSKI